MKVLVVLKHINIKRMNDESLKMYCASCDFVNVLFASLAVLFMIPMILYSITFLAGVAINIAVAIFANNEANYCRLQLEVRRNGCRDN